MSRSNTYSTSKVSRSETCENSEGTGSASMPRTGYPVTRDVIHLSQSSNRNCADVRKVGDEVRKNLKRSREKKVPLRLLVPVILEQPGQSLGRRLAAAHAPRAILDCFRQWDALSEDRVTCCFTRPPGLSAGRAKLKGRSSPQKKSRPSHPCPLYPDPPPRDGGLEKLEAGAECSRRTGLSATRRLFLQLSTPDLAEQHRRSCLVKGQRKPPGQQAHEFLWPTGRRSLSMPPAPKSHM